MRQNGVTGKKRDGWGAADDVTKMKAEYKKGGARAKSIFSRAKNKLLSLLEQQELLSRREVQDVCQRMDTARS